MNTLLSRDNQPRAQLFILIFGMVEIFIGFSGVLLSDFLSIFKVLVLISGVLGILALAFSITHPENIKIYDLLGVALLFSYGTGTLNSLISYWLDNKDLLNYSEVSQYWLSRCLGMLTAAAGFLHIVGRFDNDGYIFPQIDALGFQSKRALWFVGITTSVVVLFIAIGRLGFMANIAVQQGYANISSSAAIALDLMTPAGALAVYYWRKEDKFKWNIVFILLALMLLLIQFGLGRRIFVYSLLIYLMAALLARRPKRIFSVRNIILIAVVAILVQVATSAFYTMRVASYSLKFKQSAPSILELMPEAVKVYKDREKLHLAEQIHENLSSRTFILEYLALLSERSSSIQPLYGEDILRASVIAVPSLLYPSKYSNPLFESEEDLLNPHLRLPVWDAANSILTTGLGDFGELGFFMLPLAICICFSISLRLIYSFMPHVMGLLVSFFICKVLFSVEEDFVSYLTSVRSILIIVVISSIFFLGKKSSAQTSNA